MNAAQGGPTSGGAVVGGERAVVRGALRLNSEDTLNAQVGDLLVSNSKRRHTHTYCVPATRTFRISKDPEGPGRLGLNLVRVNELSDSLVRYLVCVRVRIFSTYLAHI